MSAVNTQLRGTTGSQPAIPLKATRAAPAKTPFGCPRDFLDNRFVYVVVSSRARGLSIGVNMNPDKCCNFDCVYCEVDRRTPSRESRLDVEAMTEELLRTLELVHSGQLQHNPRYGNLPPQLLELRDVALSGDGEPTLCPNFVEAVEAIIHIRARGLFPFFKLVLITNATALDAVPVQEGLQLFTPSDEVWAKLDAGTTALMNKVNRNQVPLQKILDNILLVARQRPLIIQSLFPLINGEELPEEEIAQYIERLKELKAAGANISSVQIYSATRPAACGECAHMPLKVLSRIARTVRAATGIKAEVF